MPRKPKKLPRGVDQLPSGVYRGRLMVNGKRVTVGSNYPTAKDAETALNIARADTARGIYVSPQERREHIRAQQERELSERYTFAQWCDRWTTYQRSAAALAPSTLDNYEGRLNNHVAPTFGDTPIRDISVADVRDWHADLVTMKSWNLTRNCYIVFHRMMADAVELELITANPVNVPRATEHRPEKDREYVATPQQVADLAAAMPEHLALSIYLASYCQLRIGEFRALTRADFTNNMHTLRVRRQVSKRGIVGPPKSKAGTRDLEVPDALVPVIADHVKHYAAKGRDGLIFPSPVDPSAYGAESAYRRHFDAAVLKVKGLPDGFTAHQLRHAGLTWFAQAGATPRELMARGGHSDAEVSLKYQHASRERDKLITGKLNDTVVL